MDFTEWLESIKPWTDLVQLFGGLGLATIVLAYLKTTVERGRWKSFKRRIDEWVDEELQSDRHPKGLSTDDWKVACEIHLFDARFTPDQIHELLDTAVVAAKGRAATKVFM